MFFTDIFKDMYLRAKMFQVYFSCHIFSLVFQFCFNYIYLFVTFLKEYVKSTFLYILFIVYHTRLHMIMIVEIYITRLSLLRFDGVVDPSYCTRVPQRLYTFSALV